MGIPRRCRAAPSSTGTGIVDQSGALMLFVATPPCYPVAIHVDYGSRTVPDHLSTHRCRLLLKCRHRDGNLRAESALRIGVQLAFRGSNYHQLRNDGGECGYRRRPFQGVNKQYLQRQRIISHIRVKVKALLVIEICIGNRFFLSRPVGRHEASHRSAVVTRASK